MGAAFWFDRSWRRPSCTVGGMPTFDFATVLQIVLALGLLNVWLLRTGKATAYRGGAAKNLKEEFATYGLPPFMYYLVGGLKIG